MLLTSLSSCFTEEEPVLPLAPHTEVISTHKLTAGQVYYSLKNQKIVKYNSVEDWDFAFACGEDDYDILVNTARGMGAYNTTSKDFNATYKYDNYPWVFDKNNGQEDQSCLGTWGDFEFENPQSFGNVYLIYLGVDIQGHGTGIIKFQVTGYEDDTYTIRIGDLEGTVQREYSVQKNDSFNFVYLSFEQSKVLTLEPPKNDWDIMFTSFTVPLRRPQVAPISFPIAKTHELVDGVLLNPYHRYVAEDTAGNLDDISFFNVESYDYTDSTDFIGRRWYDYSEEEDRYFITPNNTFIIKDEDKNFYAIKFTQLTNDITISSDISFTLKSL